MTATMNNKEKISITLPPEIVRYAEQYQQTHGLSSRSEVVLEAFKALREKELEEGYRAWAEEFKRNPDPLTEAGLEEGLEPSTEDTW
jgi:Arc/MetJ-type ribon-helix-helix transcriptional regulator